MHSLLQSMHTLKIRPLAASDSVDEITELLHDAYAPLAAQGFRFLATYQDAEVTRRRLSSGWAYVAVDGNGEIAGTITLYPSRAESACEWYQKAGNFRFGQFAVVPKFQRKGTGLRLIQAVEEKAREEGACELALDTAENAGQLIRWYGTLGFRFIGFTKWKAANYRSVVLSKGLKNRS